MELAATFPPDTSSPAGVRRFVVSAIDGSCPSAAVDVVILLSSELAANAVLHARTDFRVHLVLCDGAIRVEVADENPRQPVLSEVPLDAASGRGLTLLDSLAEAWGIRPGPDGKVIWFEVAAQGS